MNSLERGDRADRMFEHVCHGNQAEAGGREFCGLERFIRDPNAKFISCECCCRGVYLETLGCKSTRLEQGRKETCTATDVESSGALAETRFNPVDVVVKFATKSCAGCLHGQQLSVVPISIKAHDVFKCRM